MNIFVWILQSFLAFLFLHAGLCKTFFRKRKMAYLGQSGVVGLPGPLITFIGICEILGAYALVIPLWLNLVPILTPIATVCFSVIMILAIGVHLRKGQYKNVIVNVLILAALILIFMVRMYYIPLHETPRINEYLQ